jgi:lauroyl-KDO2-lipid IV(A) myristoyltransferase
MQYLGSGVFKPMKNKLVDWFVARGRSRHGSYLYSREAGLRPIIKDVRAGNVMFYLPDEDLGRERSIFAPFFGVEKATVPVLGKMAKVCKADVLPCMAEYDVKTRRYIIHILPPLKDFPSGDDYHDTVAMNVALEEIVRLCPTQYFWMMKLFKTRPQGQARIY